MREVWGFILVVAPPVVSRLVAHLGMDLGRKDGPPDHRDAQLHAFRHIRLKNGRAVTDGPGMADIALGNYLGVAEEALAEGEVESVAGKLADDAAVVLAVEFQKGLRVVAEEGRRYLQAKGGRQV